MGSDLRKLLFTCTPLSGLRFEKIIIYCLLFIKNGKDRKRRMTLYSILYFYISDKLDFAHLHSRFVRVGKNLFWGTNENKVTLLLIIGARNS